MSIISCWAGHIKSLSANVIWVLSDVSLFLLTIDTEDPLNRAAAEWRQNGRMEAQTEMGLKDKHVKTDHGAAGACHPLDMSYVWETIRNNPEELFHPKVADRKKANCIFDESCSQVPLRKGLLTSADKHCSQGGCTLHNASRINI